MNKKCKLKKIYLTLILFFIFIHNLYAKNLGIVGNVYSIVEKDFLQAVEEQAKKSDWNKKIDNMKKEITKEKIATNNIKLPHATKNRSFYVDMTYTLDFDIPKVKDGKVDGVLYKKGYRFNPLDYVVVPEVYVIFNGNRKEEVKWVETELWRYNNVLLMISEGNAIDLINKLRRPVYFLMPEIQKKFQISKTISVVYQENKKMRVDEVYIPDNTNNIATNIKK